MDGWISIEGQREEGNLIAAEPKSKLLVDVYVLVGGQVGCLIRELGVIKTRRHMEFHRDPYWTCAPRVDNVYFIAFDKIKIEIKYAEMKNPNAFLLII